MRLGPSLRAFLPDVPTVVHVSLLGVGVRASRDGLCEDILDALPSTTLIPAFSYSYTRHEAYDRATTPGRAGAFGNWARQHLARTADPLFSLAVKGDSMPEWGRIQSNSCFGQESPWAWVLAQDGIIGFLGATVESCTLIHHIEWLARVAYRHEVPFTGTTEGIDTTATYFCRRRELGLVTSLQRLEAHLDLTRRMLGTWPVAYVKARSIQQHALDLLRLDPYALVKQEGA